MIASLPMYDRPSNAAAHDRLWTLIRANLAAIGIDAPATLDRSVRYNDGWARPDLMLGHICNLPYRTSFRGKVTRIGASDYGLDDCAPGYYRSAIIARKSDPRDTLAAFEQARFAANALHSHSGFSALSDDAAAQGLTLPTPIITGAHDASVIAVADGTADFAAIDAVTWRMQQTDLPQAASVKVIGWTPASPGQTIITATQHDPARMRDAMNAAIAAQDPKDAILLGLRQIVALPTDAYDIPVAAA